mmetsp:Transcript_70163/g.195228  ORF Transcript_70163/g.195228 Transcript_70163/m.195228 type:complete len:354 (+) Transcript_70163:96-1157(+)|eukprot:CAMPEP_0117473128 /NCGR_PEP_ID=MMETSP0784-20121206/8611_1 /TAXON_ID=39447 /ORGANISM="" /LENGTH=353 /DNA_ID=CAMNT_0005267317 /DNA_START=83 /DNA_END=1144 /DNA_ORIENTATION=-
MAETYKTVAAFLEKSAALRPVVGIICGSGLSGLSNAMEDTQVFPYSTIPGFPKPTVAGHAGELVFGTLAGVPTVCMRGRFHFYEGNTMETVVMPVRAMRCLGVKVLIVTNASGGIAADLNIGDVLCIMDHFGLPCLTGQHPLSGHNDNALGPRFLPTSNAYCQKMQQVVMKAAGTLGFDFVRPHGCYAMVSGPTYESMTEAKWLRMIGVDSVGMSTIPEIIAAHHSGMKVIGLSLVTNKVVMPGDTGPHASHEEVLEEGAKRASQMQSLVKQIVKELQGELSAMKDLPKIDLPKIDLSSRHEHTNGCSNGNSEQNGVGKGCGTRFGNAEILAALIVGVAIGAVVSRKFYNFKN